MAASGEDRKGTPACPVGWLNELPTAGDEYRETPGLLHSQGPYSGLMSKTPLSMNSYRYLRKADLAGNKSHLSQFQIMSVFDQCDPNEQTIIHYANEGVGWGGLPWPCTKHTPPLQVDSLGRTESYFTEEAEGAGVQCPRSHRRQRRSRGLPASVSPCLTGSLFITAHHSLKNLLQKAGPMKFPLRKCI